MGAGPIAAMIKRLREQIEQRQAEQNPVTTPAPVSRTQDPIQTLRELAPRYQGHPYSAVHRMTTEGRAGTPQDLAWWLSYGAGPEATFFSDNTVPGPPVSGPPSVEPPGASPSPSPVPMVPPPESAPLPGLRVPRLYPPRDGLRIPAPQRRARGGALARLRGYR